jgi:hypothetical protein
MVGIDYSKWDNLSDSDEELVPSKSAEETKYTQNVAALQRLQESKGRADEKFENEDFSESFKNYVEVLQVLQELTEDKSLRHRPEWAGTRALQIQCYLGACVCACKSNSFIQVLPLASECIKV